MLFALIFNICLGIGMLGVIFNIVFEEYSEKSIQKIMGTYFRRILRVKSRKDIEECTE